MHILKNDPVLMELEHVQVDGHLIRSSMIGRATMVWVRIPHMRF